MEELVQFVSPAFVEAFVEDLESELVLVEVQPLEAGGGLGEGLG